MKKAHSVEQNNLRGLKRILKRYGWLERCGWLECFGWLGCHCMSAALEGLAWKALIQGTIIFKSDLNVIALVNINLINRSGVAGAFLQTPLSLIY